MTIPLPFNELTWLGLLLSILESVQLVPESFSYAASGNAAINDIMQLYLGIAFGFSLLFEVLSLVLRRRIAPSGRLLGILLLVLMLAGSLSFALLIEGTVAGKVGTGLVVFVLSCVVGGIPFVFLTLVRSATRIVRS